MSGASWGRWQINDRLARERGHTVVHIALELRVEITPDDCPRLYEVILPGPHTDVILPPLPLPIGDMAGRGPQCDVGCLEDVDKDAEHDESLRFHPGRGSVRVECIRVG